MMYYSLYLSPACHAYGCSTVVGVLVFIMKYELCTVKIELFSRLGNLEWISGSQGSCLASVERSIQANLLEIVLVFY